MRSPSRFGLITGPAEGAEIKQDFLMEGDATPRRLGGAADDPLIRLDLPEVNHDKADIDHKR